MIDSKKGLVSIETLSIENVNSQYLCNAQGSYLRCESDLIFSLLLLNFVVPTVIRVCVFLHAEKRV